MIASLLARTTVRKYSCQSRWVLVRGISGVQQRITAANRCSPGQYYPRPSSLSSNHRVRTSVTTSVHFLSSDAAATVADDSDAEEGMHKVKILYGTQGGTAQIFAMQLAEAIAEIDQNKEVSIHGLHEAPSPDQVLDPDALNMILVSTSGVGEPPDNARDYYNWLTTRTAGSGETNDSLASVKYAVFGLGNQKAHPNHYNVIGKSIDIKLAELGATRIHDLGLGDDGDCIEDDFDIWLESITEKLAAEPKEHMEHVAVEQTDKHHIIENDESDTDSNLSACLTHGLVQCDASVDGSGKRRVSEKYPLLDLQPQATDVVRGDLFDLPSDEVFYGSSIRKLRVTKNGPIRSGNTLSPLHEMRISLEEYSDLSYETGDHMIIYPQNSPTIVQAYLNVLDVHPHALVHKGATDEQKRYPYPSGITLTETLMHCMDLGALPSPSFTRLLLGRKDIDYKKQVAIPQKTVLDLIYESGRRPTLEELMYNVPKLKPRYYSIASSPLHDPREIVLTYRPVKYMTNQGALREGVCTSYFRTLVSIEGDQNIAPVVTYVAAEVNSNPLFRLPSDIATPVIFVAGGCGVAPIRAFLKERIALEAPSQAYGEAHLFLGFRNPADEVYQPLVSQALKCGALTTAQVSYSGGCVLPTQKCQLVSDTVGDNGALVFDLLQRGGYIYLCGGARNFGVAIEKEMLNIFQKHGNMTFEEATAHLQTLIHEGRVCEDLAD